MSNRTVTLRTASIVTIVASALLTLASTMVGASTASAQSPEVSSSPAHIWVDPTVRNANGRYDWSVVVHMPPITSHAVMHASAVRFTSEIVHCQAPRPEDGGVLSCEGRGDAIPGDYTVTMDLRSEGGQSYAWDIPLTVCPLTGCAELFSLSIDPEPMYVWADPEVTDQTYGTMRFNVAWNASEARMTPLVDRLGNVAPGDWQALFEEPGDGSSFGFEGTFTERGVYTTTITVDDEFGNPHSADATVIVCDSRGCPVLPNTGMNLFASAGLGVGALLMVVLGALVLIRRRGMNATPATRKRVV